MGRQDLCGRALRFSIDVTAFTRVVRQQGREADHAAFQLFRAATAIGALLEEGQVANSRRDMASKYAIALREARESRYWLRVLGADPALKPLSTPLESEAGEFVAMLTVSVRKLRHPE